MVDKVWKITDKGREAAQQAIELFASGLSFEEVCQEMDLPDTALRLLLFMEEAADGVAVPDDY